MSNVQKIKNYIKKQNYLVVHYSVKPRSHYAYLKAHCAKNYLGDYFIVSFDKLGYSQEPFNPSFDYEVQNLITTEVASVKAYDMGSTMILVPDMKIQIHHDAYIVIDSKYYKNDLNDEQSHYNSDINIQVVLLEYYCLHNHNLYWNQHNKGYDFHDRTILNSMIPQFKRSEMALRNRFRQRLIAMIITSCRPLLKKFSFKKFADWKTKSQPIEPECQQTNLFSRPKAVHCKQLKDINPSPFIHQLAAVDSNNVFYVQTQSHNYGDIKEIDTNPKMTDLSQFSINSSNIGVMKKIHADVTKRKILTENMTNTGGSYMSSIIWNSSKKSFMWPFASTCFIETDVPSSVALLKRHPNMEIFTTTHRDLEIFKNRYQKIYPDGCSYVETQFGPHLFSIKFQGLQNEFTNTLPHVAIPRILAYRIVKDPKTFHGDFYTNHRRAACFGDPKKIHYLIDTCDNYAENKGYTFTENDSPCLVPNNSFAVENWMYPSNTTTDWIHKNAGYRKFLSNI